MPGFYPRYFLLALLLLGLEIFIGACVHDRFIRPYAGDFLVPIFLYCLARSLVKLPAAPLVASVLLFAYLIEVSQYCHLASRLGLAHVRVARAVLGSAFSWLDMLAYTLGALLVLGLERGLNHRLPARSSGR